MNRDDIFTIDDKGSLILNKEYIRGIEPFKTILERDKGSKGDVQGRKKEQAWKEFMYIYIVASVFSFPNKGGYNDKECHEAGISESKLPSDFKPDPVIKDAIIRYKEIQLAMLPSISSLSIGLKGLRLSGVISENISRSIESTLELKQKKDQEKIDNGEEIDILSSIASNDMLITQLNQLLKITNQLPVTIENIETLKGKITKEEMGDTMGRGGQKLGNRADPNRKK